MISRILILNRLEPFSATLKYPTRTSARIERRIMCCHFVRSAEGFWFCGNPCSPSQTLWGGCELQDPGGCWKTGRSITTTPVSFSSLVESLCLFKECRELEERYRVDYTSKILASDMKDRHPIIKDLGCVIHKGDLALQLQSISEMEHLCKIASTVRWKKLWDNALDHGEACITSLKNLVRIISCPVFFSHHHLLLSVY